MDHDNRDIIRIAFYRGEYGTFLDWLLCLFQLSPYSHVEVLLGYDKSFSASFRDGYKCRIKKGIDFGNGNWVVLTAYGDAEKLQHAAAALQGARYDLAGALQSLFGGPYRDYTRFFCSEAVFHVLDYAGVWSPEIHRQLGSAKRITPKRLYKLLQVINSWHTEKHKRTALRILEKLRRQIGQTKQPAQARR